MNISNNARPHISKSPQETRALAAALAAELKDGAVLALHGELGSGKTCFVQGLARALGIRQTVTSPTFAMVHEYHGRRRLIHMDLYRIGRPDELGGIDFEDYLDAPGIVVIEWAERAGAWLPAGALHIYFKAGKGLNKRVITFAAGAPA